MEPHEYRIERMDESRFKDMDELFIAVYGRKRDHGFFSRKYDTSFTGIKNIGYLAYDGSTPAAFYGVIPCYIKYNSNLILSAQSADTMTHPMHRNKGLFTRLARLTYALCRQSGIKFVFGFPNQHSLPGFIKTLEWKQTETLDSFTIPVSKSFFVKGMKKFFLTRPVQKAYSNSILRRYRLEVYGLPNSVVGNGYAGVHRDADYLKYKKYSDTIVLEIGTAKVWVRVSNDMLIGDISGVQSNEDLRQLMDKLTSMGKRLGISSLNFQASPDTPLHKLFMNYYVPGPSFATIVLDLGSNLPFDKIKFTLADIDIF